MAGTKATKTATRTAASKTSEVGPRPWYIPPGVESYLRDRDVARLLRVGMTKIKEMIRTGEYIPPTTKIGARKLWSVEDHNAWCRERNAKSKAARESAN